MAKSLEHLYIVQTSPFPHSIQYKNSRVSMDKKFLHMPTTYISPIQEYPQVPFLLPSLS